MRHPVKIGERIYNSKKEALSHYKAILNSYNFGDVLNKSDSKEVLSLLEIDPNRKGKCGDGVKEVRVARLKYNTKCFELVRIDDTTDFTSYTKIINAPQTDFTKFLSACRQAVQEDLRKLKLSYFQKHSKNGVVKCQESGELLKWEELNIDHRQPNTFSVIVDRFIEIHQLNIAEIVLIEVDGFRDEIADNDLKEKFRKYHMNKANLRIVKKTRNLSRSHQARIIRQKKDIIIE